SGSTNVEVTDLPDRLPNAGLEHPLDSVHGRPLILIHFYAAPRLLPFVLDGQRQAVAEPLHTLEYTLTRLHDHGADLDQQLRRPHMRDRPSVCSGNVPEFHQGCSFACFRREAGQQRPQWTTAQDDPPTGHHAEPCRNARETSPPRTSRVLPATTWPVQPAESLPLLLIPPPAWPEGGNGSSSQGTNDHQLPEELGTLSR